MDKTKDMSTVLFSAGIIAAGHGTRLEAANSRTIKPLFPIRGTPLIHWTTSSLISAGARDMVVLFNSRSRAARNYLQEQKWAVQWRFLEADTASSWESFRLVAQALSGKWERFLISTVDALIPAEEISRFAAAVLDNLPAHKPAVALALTRFVEDDKPLWADLDDAGRITALGPAAVQREFVTCGLYGLNRPLVETLNEKGPYRSLRDFLTDAVDHEFAVYGIPLSKTVDVDRPEDVATAEQFVSSWKTPTSCGRIER
jgi:NDP-sugar pyrophosphorylase family protein